MVPAKTIQIIHTLPFLSTGGSYALNNFNVSCGNQKSRDCLILKCLVEVPIRTDPRTFKIK
jgi:hypothetical protein